MALRVPFQWMLLVVLLLGACKIARGQCPGGVCVSPGSVTVQPPTVSYGIPGVVLIREVPSVYQWQAFGPSYMPSFGGYSNQPWQGGGYYYGQQPGICGSGSGSYQASPWGYSYRHAQRQSIRYRGVWR